MVGVWNCHSVNDSACSMFDEEETCLGCTLADCFFVATLKLRSGDIRWDFEEIAWELK